MAMHVQHVYIDVCFPKSSAGGQLGTGTGMYDYDGENIANFFTVTQAMLVNDKLLTLWLKEKRDKKTKLCSVMCEIDKLDSCIGYFSCQPN